MVKQDDSSPTEWTRHVRWRELGLFLGAGPRRIWRGIGWLWLALINFDRWDRRAIAQGWDRAKARVARYYLLPVFVIAAVISPVWLDLLGEVVGNLSEQLGTEPPPVSDGAARRAYYYSVGLTITGLGALLAAPFILIKAWVNERTTTAAEQGLITERFTRAVEQLGAEKVVKMETPLPERDAKGRFQKAKESIERTEPNIEVRLGAIYALERIAQDSERDHIPIMETLCAYVRENAPASAARDLNLAEWEPRPDAMSAAEAALRAAEFKVRFDAVI